jgi:hypothetical protein
VTGLGEFYLIVCIEKFFENTKVAHILGPLLRLRLRTSFGKKKDWASFWAIFTSQTHLGLML